MRMALSKGTTSSRSSRRTERSRSLRVYSWYVSQSAPCTCVTPLSSAFGFACWFWFATGSGGRCEPREGERPSRSASFRRTIVCALVSRVVAETGAFLEDGGGAHIVARERDAEVDAGRVPEAVLHDSDQLEQAVLEERAVQALDGLEVRLDREHTAAERCGDDRVGAEAGAEIDEMEVGLLGEHPEHVRHTLIFPDALALNLAGQEVIRAKHINGQDTAWSFQLGSRKLFVYWLATQIHIAKTIGRRN